MPSPMDHILTRNMSEGVSLVLEDVMQVIVTLVVNRTVGAAGIALSGPGAQGDRLVALRHGFRHHRLHRIVMKQATMITKDFHYILLPNLCTKRCYFLGNRRQVYQFK